MFNQPQQLGSNRTTSIQYGSGASPAGGNEGGVEPPSLVMKDPAFGRACSYFMPLSGGGEQATSGGHRPVYEVLAGPPSWESLYRLLAERVAAMVDRSIVDALTSCGRSTPQAEKRLRELKAYLSSELPVDVSRDVLNVALNRDRLRCHHNPTDCLALELWRVFFPLNGRGSNSDTPSSLKAGSLKSTLTEVSVVHHEFGFPKTTNYPDIVQNVERLFDLVGGGDGGWGVDHGTTKTTSSSDKAMKQSFQKQDKTVTSFRLELKHCEVGCFVKDRVISCVGRLGENLRVLEIPRLGSDELLGVLARRCPNLEVLNVKGSREQVTDQGLVAYVDILKDKTKLVQLDITRCMLSQQSLPSLQKLSRLRDLRISTRVLDEVGCSVSSNVPTPEEPPTVLSHVEAVTVEHDNIVQVSVSQVLAYLKSTFPGARQVSLRNCVACELHVTLTQQPSNIAYMRQNIHTLELMSADYFNFPRLVYPCPNLQTLQIEKPTNDIFNTEGGGQHAFIHGDDDVPFVNLRVLRLSRISLTNLTQFLSKSNALKTFKVTNIGRRERPRWTDCRIRQILPQGSLPELEEFHVSCLPNEGLSTVENHRFLHLTSETVRYLTDNFSRLRRIGGLETWNPRTCDRESLNLVLASRPPSKTKFHLTT